MDAAIAVWVATHRIPGLDGFFVALGTVDRLGAIWALLALAVGLLRRCSARQTTLLVGLTLLATFAADSISFGLKDLVVRTRPFVAHPEIHPLYTVHSSSFPAGHAATSFAGAVLLTLALRRGAPLFLALAAAIAFSRVYVGVHYPTDVLAGAAVGAAVGAVAAVIFRLVGGLDGTPRRVVVGRNVRTAA